MRRVHQPRARASSSGTDAAALHPGPALAGGEHHPVWTDIIVIKYKRLYGPLHGRCFHWCTKRPAPQLKNGVHAIANLAPSALSATRDHVPVPVSVPVPVPVAVPAPCVWRGVDEIQVTLVLR